MSHYTKESTFEDYGKGTPGWHWSVMLMYRGKPVAEADGPNVHGPSNNGFRDWSAVGKFRDLDRGKVDPIFVEGLLDERALGKVTKIEHEALVLRQAVTDMLDGTLVVEHPTDADEAFSGPHELIEAHPQFNLIRTELLGEES